TRQTRGKRNARRLRSAGYIPAILYGHGEACVSLSLEAGQIGAAVRHGSRIVELDGALQEKAFIRDIQWDPFGNAILHVDLTRVAADEKVTVNVALELRGVAPGTKAGGMIENPVHDLEIECPAARIPEKLQLNINNLQLGESLTAAALDLPEGARLMVSQDTVLVQCVEPHVEAEEEAVPEAVEPELIGRKPAGEETESAGS
ncbi:MAG: 50S ribosomal protein L25, partial [Planctomycetales bacterium]|nr:50S ribosomal protein L25 [Planctomycetales bacterium]NIM09127.1 50S ribosomal protein L25 [Planctomycetales bacterium]NIN08594.1 50S ribosomal protein L25 [Planctomycetales bacterium]NIN77720.1 50S ribosomal protein L25 [Planctomycetales bacterium]NIO34892.1 50S ribosomal protein L25 [Planctomycetales bacterium]